jgi:hypothetical protein
MAIKFKSLAQPDLLKRIQPENLIRLLEDHRMFFEMKGFDVPREAHLEIDYLTLAAVLAQPDEDMPGDLVDALHLISTIGGDDRFDELLDLAAANEIEVDGETTALDLATAIYLKNPGALARKENEEFFQKRKTFESFRAADPTITVAIEDLPSDVALLEGSLDQYCQRKKRGVGCRIIRTESAGEVRFLVVHGQPCRREPSRKGPKSTSTFFRPERTDLVIYDAVHNELRINAGTIGDLKEYRAQFGAQLFGDEGKFVFAEKYTLEPLKQDPQAALACRDVAGIESVALREIEYYWGGAFDHVEIQRADGLLNALALIRRTIEAEAHIRKAVFKVKLTGEKKARSVTVKAGNKSGYNRGEEAALIEQWLHARGFVLVGEAANAHVEPALAGA